MKTKIISTLNFIGLGFLVPIVRLLSGEDPKAQFSAMWSSMGLPIVAFVIFLSLWGWAASGVQTSLGEIPGPSHVWVQAKSLYQDHLEEVKDEKAFYERQRKRNEQILAQNPDAEVRTIDYTGKATYLDQIKTSLYTVFVGFLIASIVALPIGIFCGLSKPVMTALNPIIQILKPVSPLAWLPIVTMVVSAVYVSEDPFFQKSFIISAITVSLCSLWATLINTAMGVASVDPDYINVAKVLKLSTYKKIFKIILPASLPLIFTGLRISLGVGWMVLIAAEMLAQNPGLGKFVWDEFQNGSSNSLANIMVAVFTVGLIGFFLDRIMVLLQKLVSFEGQESPA